MTKKISYISSFTLHTWKRALGKALHTWKRALEKALYNC